MAAKGDIPKLQDNLLLVKSKATAITTVGTVKPTFLNMVIFCNMFYSQECVWKTK